MARAATSRLKVNPPLGAPPTLEWRAVGELLIDPAYQRLVDTGPSQTLIRRIAMYWDWGLCQPLAVSRRPDGALTIVDGQHRASAAKLRGDLPHLPCVITSYSSAGDEAAAFVALNQLRRPLSALDLFKAAVAAQDTEALGIVAAIEGVGLSLAKHSNYTVWKAGDVSHIGGIQRAYRVYGSTACTEALSVLALAWPNDILRYAGTLWSGISRLVAEHDESYDRDVFVGVLREKSQREWVNEATAKSAETGHRRQLCMFVVMRDAFLRTVGRLEITAQNVVELKPAPTPESMKAGLLIGKGETRWCEQCDEKRTFPEAEQCRSRFCSLRKRA